MSDLLIYGGRIIDPSQGLDIAGSVLVKNGLIKSYIPTGQEIPVGDDLEIIDVEGLIIAPGFIDLHTHLREPGFEQKETISSGVSAAIRGGFTTICAMPNTLPTMDDPTVIKSVQQSGEQLGLARVLPIGSVTKGRAGEELTDIIELSKTGAVGFSDDGNPVTHAHIMRTALEYSEIVGVPIINHCEDPSLSRHGVMNEGIISHRLGLRGIPITAETSMAARDMELVSLTNGRLHLAHISAKRTLELLQDAKTRGLPVTAEVTPHHLLLTENWVLGGPMRQMATSTSAERIRYVDQNGFDTHAKVNPPLRTAADAQGLISGLREGVIDAIATDHAPHTREDKATTFQEAEFGISGLETAFGLLMTLVHQNLIPLRTLIERLTVGPARVLGSDRQLLGTLKVGSLADITVLNPEIDWEVDPGIFTSKGRNTPLEGMRLKGKVVLTVYKGNIVYRDTTYLKD